MSAPDVRIAVHDLDMQYGEQVIQLNLNFTIRTGEIFVIMRDHLHPARDASKSPAFDESFTIRSATRSARAVMVSKGLLPSEVGMIEASAT